MAKSPLDHQQEAATVNSVASAPIQEVAINSNIEESTIFQGIFVTDPQGEVIFMQDYSFSITIDNQVYSGYNIFEGTLFNETPAATVNSVASAPIQEAAITSNIEESTIFQGIFVIDPQGVRIFMQNYSFSVTIDNQVFSGYIIFEGFSPLDHQQEAATVNSVASAPIQEAANTSNIEESTIFQGIFVTDPQGVQIFMQNYSFSISIDNQVYSGYNIFEGTLVNGTP
ncbi:unnamed protein product [Diamesa tonsa]